MNRLKWMFSEILMHYFQVPKEHVSNCWGRKWVAFVSEFLSPVLHLTKLNRSDTASQRGLTNLEKNWNCCQMYTANGWAAGVGGGHRKDNLK